jgi:hypothetical protein
MSFAIPSKPSSAKMVVSLIMPPLTHSSPPMGYFFRYLAHTLLNRTVKSNASFAPSIICCVPSIPARYRVEGLHTTTYLLNHLPTQVISMTSPYFALHGVAPFYVHLRVFGCASYPNLSAKATHKLIPRSTRCVFLGYFVDHKGYWCLDLTTINVVISQHIDFDEVDFPFSASPCLTNDLDIFL